MSFDKDLYWKRRKANLRGQTPGTDKERLREARILMRRERAKQLEKLKGGKNVKRTKTN